MKRRSVITRLAPKPLVVGRYNGPYAFAIAPASRQLTPLALLALARSDTLIATVGDKLRIQPSPSFRQRLRQSYRLALCGARPSEAPLNRLLTPA